MRRLELEEEYDQHYLLSPFKWDDNEKNHFCADIARTLFLSSKKIEIRMLDIGCGSGKTLQIFNQRFPKWLLYGMDLSNESLRLTRSRVPAARLEKGMVGDVLFNTHFNFITILGVLEHIENIDFGLRQIRELLYDGGFLYIEVPNCISYDFSEKAEGFRRLNGGSRQIEWHLYRETWELYIKNSGLHIVATIKGFRPWIEFIWIVSNRPIELPAATLRALNSIEVGYRARSANYSQKSIFRFIQKIIGQRLTRKIRDWRHPYQDGST